MFDPVDLCSTWLTCTCLNRFPWCTVVFARYDCSMVPYHKNTGFRSSLRSGLKSGFRSDLSFDFRSYPNSGFSFDLRSSLRSDIPLFILCPFYYVHIYCSNICCQYISCGNRSAIWRPQVWPTSWHCTKVTATVRPPVTQWRSGG